MSPQQTRPTSHKERLLRQGMKHFYAHGYHGTTVDAVLEASGVPKGSFYHHFGSKEAFGRAVLHRYMTYQLDLLTAWIDKTDLSTSDRLTGYFDDMARQFIDSDYRRACLAGKFSTEVAAELDSFRTQLDSDLRTWRARLLATLQQGQQRGDVRRDRTGEELADALLALVQGAFVIALSLRDDQYLRAVSTTITVLLTPPPAPAPTTN